MSEMTTYTGGCHCGAVKYETDADLGSVMECNCSHCSKKGFLLAFTPKQNFRLLSGEDALGEYRFNTGKIAHLFCTNCGVQSFGAGVMPDGSEMRAINVRCLDNVDCSTLDIQQVDGKNF